MIARTAKKSLLVSSRVCLDMLDVLCVTRQEVHLYLLIYLNTLPNFSISFSCKDMELITAGSSILGIHSAFNRMSLYRVRKSLSLREVIVLQGYTGKQGSFVTYSLNLPQILIHAIECYNDFRVKPLTFEIKDLEEARLHVRKLFKEKGIPNTLLRKVR